MSYLITALISAAIVHGYHKGWLDTPIAAAVDLVKNWGKKVSTLDEANAAPPASDTERKTALGWIALVMLIGLVAVVLSGILMWKNHQAHKAEVAKITAPVVLPPEPPIYKRIFKPKHATKEITNSARITPPRADFSSIKKAEKPAEVELNQENIAHENDTQDSAEVMTLPLRPIPPIPPQRSIP